MLFEDFSVSFTDRDSSDYHNISVDARSFGRNVAQRRKPSQLSFLLPHSCKVETLLSYLIQQKQVAFMLEKVNAIDATLCAGFHVKHTPHSRSRSKFTHAIVAYRVVPGRRR